MGFGSHDRHPVNVAARVASRELQRWTSVLVVVLGASERGGLTTSDESAERAFEALCSGAWLAALQWLALGPRVAVDHASADPIGSLLAAVVLRVVAHLALVSDWHGATPYQRAVLDCYQRALERRPARNPLGWALECLGRARAPRWCVEEVERLTGVLLDVETVAELAAVAVVDWESEAVRFALAKENP